MILFGIIVGCVVFLGGVILLREVDRNPHGSAPEKEFREGLDD